MELGYWGIKGIAEPLRYLLSYLKLSYKEVNPSDASDWEIMKNEYQFDFPNLPFFVDGDIKITESDSIAMYISYKADRMELFGKPGIDSVKHRMLLDVLKELRKSLFQVAMSESNKDVFDKFNKSIYEKKLGCISNFLSDKQFLLGYITYSDFYLHYDSYIMEAICKALERENPINKYQNLIDHAQNMKQLEGLKDYFDNDIRNFFPYLIQRVDKLKLE